MCSERDIGCLQDDLQGDFTRVLQVYRAGLELEPGTEADEEAGKSDDDLEGGRGGRTSNTYLVCDAVQPNLP